MSDHTITACRHLWAAVANTAINEHRILIARARAGWAGKRVTIGGTRLLVGTVDDEIARARRYFDSADFREVCGCAGLEANPEKVMAWVCQMEGAA